MKEQSKTGIFALIISIRLKMNIRKSVTKDVQRDVILYPNLALSFIRLFKRRFVRTLINPFVRLLF